MLRRVKYALSSSKSRTILTHVGNDNFRNAKDDCMLSAKMTTWYGKYARNFTHIKSPIPVHAGMNIGQFCAFFVFGCRCCQVPARHVSSPMTAALGVLQMWKSVGLMNLAAAAGRAGSATWHADRPGPTASSGRVIPVRVCRVRWQRCSPNLLA